jgi:hypothetical protein
VTSWQKLEERRIAGCMTSPILFVMEMSTVAQAEERDTRASNKLRDLSNTKYKGFGRNCSLGSYEV